MKKYLAIALCLAVIGCGIQNRFPRKTQLETDQVQCAYGVVVPRNIDQKHRADYINKIAVPACLRAKGYRTEDLP